MKIVTISFIFILYLNSLHFCQISSLTENYDARAIAMGESFVANPNGLFSPDNNPATLIGQKGVSLFHNRRNINWFNELDDFVFYSFGAAFKTSFGNFAFTYKRYDLGESVIRTTYNPVGVATMKANYYTAVLSYANNITENLSAGMNVKIHGFSADIVKGDYTINEGNTPVIFDFGLLYRMNGFINQPYAKDDVHFGASVTNYGTDYKPDNFGYAGVGRVVSNVVKIPRLLKLGFAYKLDVKSNNETELFNFLFTGEYNYLLNSYRQDSEKDFWGVGMQTSFFNILFLRMGGVANPYTSIYGNKGVLSIRYGFGINFPFELIGFKYPVSLAFDYAVIPLSEVDYFFNKQKKNLDAFNISVNFLL